MEIGKIIKIHKNVPKVIPVTLPKRKKRDGIPVPTWPQRKTEKVPSK